MAETRAPEPCTCSNCDAVHPSDWEGWEFTARFPTNGKLVGVCASHYVEERAALRGAGPKPPPTCPCGRPGDVNNGGLCEFCC